MKKYILFLMLLLLFGLSENPVMAAPAQWIEFDGVDDYIVIPHAENLNFGRSDEFTLELWMKPAPVQSNAYDLQNVIIMKINPDDNTTPYLISYADQPYVIEGAVMAGRQNENQGLSAILAHDMKDGDWHHLALVKRGDYIELYKDGILIENKVDLQFGETKNNNDIIIGGVGEVFMSMFTGSVADIRIWETARTEEEIVNNMNAELTGSEVGLAGYWKLDGMRNGMIKDYSPSANHGTSYGMELEELGDDEESVDETIKEQLVEMTIVPGALSIIKPVLINGFNDVTLNGNVQSTNASLDAITVIDARGSGEGWHITVSATEFAELGGNGYKMPSGSLTLKSPSTVYGIDGSTSTPPAIIPGPFVIDGGATHTILTATEGDALGSFTAEFPVDALTLTINPGLILVDKEHYGDSGTPYESTLTWSIISGP